MYIVTHKKFEQPKEWGYKSILVGAYKDHCFGDLYDDVGDNISAKNPYYCELTGIYWLWKHVSDDYIGIVHYRRYFSNAIRYGVIAPERVMTRILDRYDMILPFISKLPQSVEEHYCEESGLKKDIIRVREILKEKYPEYLDTYDLFMADNQIHFFNMMVCKKQLFDAYCQWLFDILFELEEKVNYDDYTDYQKRIFGFLSERLLNVYIRYNHLKIFEMGVINTEEKWSLKKKMLTGMKRWLLYRMQLFTRSN